MKDVALFISMGCTIIATLCALVVAVRSGRWRETDEAVALIKRIDTAEGRLDRIETAINSLPSKEDLAVVRGEVHATRDLLNVVRSGVERIEGYMMSARS